MTSTDLRNATYAGLMERLPELRLLVYRAYQAHGPGTTRQVAYESGIDLLSFRPRSTELQQLGLVVQIGHWDNQGIYAAADAATWEANHAKEFPRDEQLTFFAEAAR